MKKLVAKILTAVLLVASVLSCLMVSGCKGKTYKWLYLDEAYESGWLTREEIRSVAYYYNRWASPENEPETPDFDLIPYQESSEETKQRIKYTFLQDPLFEGWEATIENIVIKKSFGVYNGYAVVLFGFQNLKDVVMTPLPPLERYHIDGVHFYDYYRDIAVYDTN